MTSFAYTILIAGWLGWASAFIRPDRSRTKVVRRSRAARWGIVLQAVAYSLLWQNKFWARGPKELSVIVAAALFAISALIAWTARVALGRHWRVDAALGAEHELVQSGI